MSGGDAGYGRAKEAKERHAASLMTMRNVVGVGVGKRRRERGDMPEWVVVVYVSEKVPESELDSADMVPRKLDGVPTAVVESGTPIPYAT